MYARRTEKYRRPILINSIVKYVPHTSYGKDQQEIAIKRCH